jgi:general secretion pathway protein K
MTFAPLLHKQQRGAALLVAMLIVALVATLASAAMWQQWRTTAVESAQRQTSQAHWLLIGATGWARVILREDANAAKTGDGTDNLQEPWAIALQETQLSTFVAGLPNSNTAISQDPLAEKVYLSGQITDLQGRLNLHNLINGNQINRTAYQSFQRLFQLLNLSPASLNRLTQNLLLAQQNTSTAPLWPAHTSQLGWLGLSHDEVQLLSPYVTLLPQNTTLNINTASAPALFAAINTLSLSQAQSLIQQRQNAHWKSVGSFLDSAKVPTQTTDTTQIDVKSSYFETLGTLRIDEQSWTQRCALWRTPSNVQTLWCENGQWASL